MASNQEWAVAPNDQFLNAPTSYGSPFSQYQQTNGVYTDLSEVPNNGFMDPNNDFPHNTLYLPNSTYDGIPPNYNTGMGDALPELGLNEVESVLHAQNSLNNLSLEGAGLLITPDTFPTTTQQQLHQFTSFHVNGSMSSSNTSGSISNGPLPNEAGGSHTGMQTDQSSAPHHISILEEPMGFGYRFRYEVEGKAHGGLQGQSSKNNGTKRGNKIYPEIQVCNVPSHISEVEIEARLVAATEDYLPHPNKCSGKDCGSRGIFRKTLRRIDHPDFKLMLNNLTILQIKKTDQKASLLGQLQEMREQLIRMGRPCDELNGDLEKKAEELVKGKHNGVVRIRFEAAYKDPLLNGKWQVACQHSISVHDQKQTNAAELRICRISVASSPASGGVEVYLLCEKVTKDDIKVKFRDGKWEAEGKFQGTDVHYQYAIVFRAPAYKKLDIKKPVDVDLMLFRPSTGTYSKAIRFQYHPERSAEEAVQRKRKRVDAPGPSRMDGYKPYDSTYRPSPGGDSNSPPYGHFSPPGAGGGFPGPSGAYWKAEGSSEHGSGEGETPMDLSKKQSETSIPSTIELVEGDSASKKKRLSIKEEPESPAATADSPASTVGSPAATADSPASTADSPATATAGSPDSDSKGNVEAGEDSDTDTEEVEIDGGYLPRKSTDKLGEPTLSSAKPEVVEVEEMTKKLTITDSKSASIEPTKMSEAESTRRQLERERRHRARLERHVVASEDFVVESLMNYAVTGDHLYFISQFRYFLGVKDESGDNSLHLAVINGQTSALGDMLRICSATKTTRAVNQLNDKQQTPILVATIIKHPEMVEMLLKHGADPTIADSEGNSCFHIAAHNRDQRIMGLLCRWFAVSGKDRTILDQLNYQGQSALHRAVYVDSMSCMRELLNVGADVNKGDATSGRTPLHYTVLHSSVVSTAELLVRPDIDTNKAAFDGNTALHTAISLKNGDIVNMLIKSGADPSLKNRQREYDYENDEEIIGLDAYQLCEKDSKMLAVIEKVPERSSKQRSMLSDTIHSIPDETRERLSVLLDAPSKDWKKLARCFDLTSLMEYMELQANPTLKLLIYLDKQDKTITDLKKGLASIGRQDCVEVIEKAFMMRLSERHGKRNPAMSIKDSGFGECTSENLKSDTLR